MAKTLLKAGVTIGVTIKDKMNRWSSITGTTAQLLWTSPPCIYLALGTVQKRYAIINTPRKIALLRR
jgi:hypothetical protein